MNNQAICLSHIGNRPNQEDNFLFCSKYLSQGFAKKMEDQHLLFLTSDKNNDIEIYAVSDGMGGHNGGEVASYTCVKELVRLLPLIENATNRADIPNIVQGVIDKINRDIIKISKQEKSLSNMGTTLILLIKYYDFYIIYNIGDSRAYYFNDDKIIQLTKDHTEGQRMLDLGILNREELKNFQDRFTLNRYLGLNKEGLKLEADEKIYKFKQPGYILLCSDGITDLVSNQNIFNTLTQSDDLLENSKELFKMALRSQQSDNLTMILVPVS